MVQLRWEETLLQEGLLFDAEACECVCGTLVTNFLFRGYSQPFLSHTKKCFLKNKTSSFAGKITGHYICL